MWSVMEDMLDTDITITELEKWTGDSGSLKMYCNSTSPLSVDSDQTVGPNCEPWSPLSDDTPFYSPPEDMEEYQVPATLSPCPLTTLSEELDLATATLKAEATGSQTPLIKEELRYKIQKKRRQSGLRDLEVEYKPLGGPEVLTKADEIRRSRRRASNRRAATKCREKKKLAADSLKTDFERLQQENQELKQQVEHLHADRKRLQETIQCHQMVCQVDLQACLPSPQPSVQDGRLTPGNDDVPETNTSPSPSMLSQLEEGPGSFNSIFTDLDLAQLLSNTIN